MMLLPTKNSISSIASIVVVVVAVAVLFSISTTATGAEEKVRRQDDDERTTVLFPAYSTVFRIPSFLHLSLSLSYIIYHTSYIIVE